MTAIGLNTNNQLCISTKEKSVTKEELQWALNLQESITSKGYTPSLQEMKVYTDIYNKYSNSQNKNTKESISSPEKLGMRVSNAAEILKKHSPTSGETLYNIKTGDTLESISNKTLSKTSSVKEKDEFINGIVNLNSDIIKDKNKIYAGDTIALPSKGNASSKVDFLGN
ncbi:MAG: LysM peptidoglycan-binding domain-containing protein [Candidatus Sericytochromatia bacterium]